MVMQIEFVEPFDHYPSAIDAVTPGSAYTQWIFSQTGNAFPFSWTTGFDGAGRALAISMGVQAQTIRRPFTSTNKISCHFGFKITDLQASVPAIPFLAIYDAGHLQQLGLRISQTGKIELIGEGNAIVATSAINLQVGIAYRISFCVDMSVADATKFSLAVNSATPDANFNDITVDAQDQATQVMAEFQMNQPTNGNISFVIDDIVLGSGDAVIWGPLEVALHAPNVDIVNDFSRSTGANNWANVDEIPFTGDTDYNFSSTTGQRDIFGIVDPAAVPEFVICVSQLTLARKEDSAARTMRNVLRIGATDYNGADQNMSDLYAHHWEHWEQDPSTSLDWDPADFAALASGYENRT